MTPKTRKYSFVWERTKKLMRKKKIIQGIWTDYSQEPTKIPTLNFRTYFSPKIINFRNPITKSEIYCYLKPTQLMGNRDNLSLQLH